MPEPEVKSNWADDFEDDNDDASSGPIETIKDNIKTVVEYRNNADGKKVKVTRQYRIEKRQVSKTVALRKTWPKFGLSRNDGPGPQPSTTVITEEVSMQFITSKDDIDKPQDDNPFEALKKKQGSTVRCRVCKQDHFTHNCPHKDALTSTKAEEDKKPAAALDGKNASGAADAPKKYVPPSRRDGASNKGESMTSQKDDQPTIRISNLSESTKETDLQELCKPFGKINRIYLGKNKQTGESRGFAYVTFYSKEDANKAIMTLNGFGYDHLILKVEWSTTSKK